MDAIQRLLTLARAYAQAENVGLSTVSWRVFNDTKKLGALEAGADIQMGRYEKSLQWFSDNWPPGLPWPDDIGRPAPSEPAQAAS